VARTSCAAICHICEVVSVISSICLARNPKAAFGFFLVLAAEFPGARKFTKHLGSCSPYSSIRLRNGRLCLPWTLVKTGLPLWVAWHGRPCPEFRS